MVEGKQVKVDNWGIFFLQRLQQFYNKTFFCDLTLQFEDNVQIKVHRLVMNACTEYFQMLENTCQSEKDCLLMPSNLPSDVVIPIINFMYSGILEFHESLFDRLYATAKLMNMSVLTKLLDAQKNPIKPVTPVPKRVQSVTPITWNLQGKKIMTKGFIEPDLPETLPGRKLPIWKRKSAPSSVSFVSTNSANSFDGFSTKTFKSSTDDVPKPTRFEWPDEDDSNFENSFDDISYTSKPLILPPFSTVPKEKNPKPSTSSTFEEIKRTAVPVKRSASPIGNQCKKVNIQDVKEYLKEHKIRSDFIDYDDSEMADNDLQTYDNDDSNEECSKDASDVFTQNTEESPSKSILKSESSSGTTNKHVRFSLEGKENSNVKIQSLPGKSNTKTSSTKQESTVDMSKHTKIITEVLKKYPHLVKNNKNIRLKILAKGNNATSTKLPKPQTTPKPVSKVSYMVMKPDANQKTNVQLSGDKETISNPDAGAWECTRCEEPKPFKSYQTYRQHLTEVHNEKQDSQMCILCGHISRKQNMLVYHKYIKHNIPPPAMYNFPKCKDCDYVALSQTLLLKHQASHNVASNLQKTSHSQDRVTPNYGCNYCDKRFFSENNLHMHVKKSHETEIKPQAIQIKEEIVTQEVEQIDTPKSKEKIKILSDIKVSTSLPSGTVVPVRTISDIRMLKQDTSNTAAAPEPLEPSSEAEALSNVASGIAASLGLVDTIVVLDDNQFILQSTQHGNIQENILNTSGENFILPEMQISDLTTITSSSIEQVTQHPTVALSSDTNTVLTQSLTKTGMSSTDELVMVLTDHDYSDATNNAVITDNNIVVLYSHPVQTQAMMINSETGMIEVGKNYAVTSEIPVSVSDQVVNCEESIEMIQQEINSQLDTETNVSEQTVGIQEYVKQEIEHNEQPEAQEKMITESSIQTESNTYQVRAENVTMILEHDQPCENQETVQVEEMTVANNQDLEESIEMIQDEINRIPLEATEEIVTKIPENQDKNCEGIKVELDTAPSLPENTEITHDVYQMETEVNYEQVTPDAKYPEEIISHYTENVPENEESVNDEQIITQEDPSIEKQNDEAIDAQTENIQMITSEIEEKEMKNDVVMINDDLEGTNHFTSEVITHMDVDEQQSEYIVQKSEEIENITQMEDNTENSTENLNVNVESMSKNVENIQEKNIIVSEYETQEIREITIQNIHTNVHVTHQILQKDLPENEDRKEIHIQEAQEDTICLQTEEPETIIENEKENAEVTEQGIDTEVQIQEQKDLEENKQCAQSDTCPELEADYYVKVNENVEEDNASITKENLNNIVDDQVTKECIINETEENTTIIEENIIVPLENSNPQEAVVIPENDTIITEVTDETNNTIEETRKIDNITEENIQDEENRISEDYIVEEKCNNSNENVKTDINASLQNEKISKLLDDWDDGDTDSQQSFSKSVPSSNTPSNSNSINKLIDDWEDEEDT